MAKQYNYLGNTSKVTPQSTTLQGPKQAPESMDFASYAYKDPQFALGTLIGQYVANKWWGNTLKGVVGDGNVNPEQTTAPTQEQLYGLNAAVPQMQVGPTGTINPINDTTPLIMGSDGSVQVNPNLTAGVGGNSANGTGLFDLNALNTAAQGQYTPQAINVNPNGTVAPSMNIQPSNGTIPVINGQLGGNLINGKLTYTPNGITMNPLKSDDSQTGGLSDVQTPVNDDEIIRTVEISPITDEQPISEETPIKEDKKEVLDGNNMKIMSAADGNLYDFKVTDDGRYIEFGKYGKLPIEDKENLINAMHDPKQSFSGLEQMSMPIHETTYPMSENDANIINKDPSKFSEWQGKVNNIDLRDKNDPLNPDSVGDAPIVSVGPDVEKNKPPTPFKADDWQTQFIQDQVKKGTSPTMINAALQVLRPQADARERDYNKYMTDQYTPILYSAIELATAGKTPWSNVSQIAEQLREYAPDLANYYLSVLPTPNNFYAKQVAESNARTTQAYAMERQRQQHLYNKDLKEQAFKQNVQLHAMDNNARLAMAQLKAQVQERIAQAKASAKSSGTKSGSGSTKVSASEKKILNEATNRFNQVLRPGDNGELNGDDVEEFRKFITDNYMKLDPDTAETLYSMAAFAEGALQKSRGDDDGAQEYWRQLPKSTLQRFAPDMNFDGYDDW